MIKKKKKIHILVCYGSMEGKGDIFIIFFLFLINLDEKHDIAI
jgi:hypothetical protein